MPLSLDRAITLRDRYRILEQIGHGGRVNIYLAEDMRLEGRLCVLKEVEYEHNIPEDIQELYRAQFVREATILARLDHPNLPKVSDFFSIQQCDYLVMDYVSGQDLNTLILEMQNEDGFLSEYKVLSWANQLADALIYLHDQDPPIIHLNINPGNLKVTPLGMLKLIDFSLVRILDADEIGFIGTQESGNLRYAPIEQSIGGDSQIDVRADIYSFGSTLYHLLTNEPPVQALERFLNPSSLIPPREINHAVSLHTQKAILWAMSLHPEERPDSMKILYQNLIGGNEIMVRQLFPSHRVFEWPQFVTREEKLMAWVGVFLFLLGLIESLLH